MNVRYPIQMLAGLGVSLEASIVVVLDISIRSPIAYYPIYNDSMRLVLDYH